MLGERKLKSNFQARIQGGGSLGTEEPPQDCEKVHILTFSFFLFQLLKEQKMNKVYFANILLLPRVSVNAVLVHCDVYMHGRENQCSISA